MLVKSVLAYALTWEGTMRARIIVVFVTGLVAASSFIPGPAKAQTTPTVQADTAKAIGKVATVIGSVTIEHVNAVVVQANVASQPEQTKVGDSVYLGDVVPVSYTHLRAHETRHDLVCRLLLEKKKKKKIQKKQQYNET